jgi:hypothetical protein
MAKHPQDIQWIESLLPPDFIRKPMFGGFGFDFEETLVLELFESIGERTYRGKQFRDKEKIGSAIYEMEKKVLGDSRDWKTILT